MISFRISRPTLIPSAIIAAVVPLAIVLKSSDVF
jgi:hypothetical protein